MDISIEKARLLGEKDSVNPVGTSNFGFNLTNVPRVKFVLGDGSNRYKCIEQGYDEAGVSTLIGQERQTLTSEDIEKIGEAKKLVIKEGSSGVNKDAFDTCENIEEIEIPRNIIEIPSFIFKNCNNLKKVKLLGSIPKIERGVFSGCENLESIELNSVGEISSGAFENFKSLKKVRALGKIEEIGCGAFSGCESLESIELNSVGEISSWAFENFKSLKKVRALGKIERIGCSAFSGCEGLESIELNGVIEISMWAFENCKSLKRIELSENIKKIGERAFGNCENLLEIIPKLKLNTFDKSAFDGCEKLDYIKSFEIDFSDYHEKVLDERFTYQDEDSGASGIIIEDASNIPLFSEIRENIQDEPIPVMSDIKQGNIGDCWLVAALASIANCQPDFIRNMIRDNTEDDKFVDVTFQRELISGVFKKEIYTVKKSIFKTEIRGEYLSIMSESSNNIWVQMIEKAFSAYLANGSQSINFNNIDVGGIDEKNAFKAIFGKKARGIIDNGYNLSTEELFVKIRETLDKGIPLVYSQYGSCGMVKDINGYELNDSHEYSLIDAKKEGGKYYMNLRNPWGSKDDVTDEDNKIITVDLGQINGITYKIGNLGEEYGAY